jgi:hypothetical protein
VKGDEFVHWTGCFVGPGYGISNSIARCRVIYIYSDTKMHSGAFCIANAQTP